MYRASRTPISYCRWCSHSTVGFHYPAEVDSRATIALLSRFTVAEQVGECVLLRRGAPRPLARRSTLRQTLLNGQPVVLPPDAGGLIWAELVVQEAFLGRLVRSVLKPAPLFLEVSRHDGRSALHPIMPPMTSQGFLLSLSRTGWPALEAAARGDVSGDSVSGFRVVPWRQGALSSDAFYAPEVQVTLTTLGPNGGGAGLPIPAGRK